MATIETVGRSSGTVWRVKWRDNGVIPPGGRKAPQTVTCYVMTQAEKLRDLVDKAGNRMPDAKVLDAYGLRWVLGDEAVQEPEFPRRVTVSDLCRLYLQAKKDSPKPPSHETMKGYEQVARDHIEGHWFGALGADDADQDQARLCQAEIAARPAFSPQSANNVRSSVAAPAFKWGQRTTKKDERPIRTWTSPFHGLPLLEETVARRDGLETMGEIQALIEVAYEIDPNWADLVVAKLCSGSRYGEITMPTANGVRRTQVEALTHGCFVLHRVPLRTNVDRRKGPASNTSKRSCQASWRTKNWKRSIHPVLLPFD